MNYLQLKKLAESGDILFHAGDSWGAKILRMGTAGQFSHVALLVRMNGGLFVAEVVPCTGFTITPASQRIPAMMKGGNVWYGPSPYDMDDRLMRSVIMNFRGTSHDYSYWAGFKTWFAQITGRDYQTKLVCSTFVQKVWERSGMTKLEKPADPEDLFGLVSSADRLEE